MKVSRPDEYSLISFKTVTETASSGQLASAMIKGQKSDSLFLGPKANVLPRKPNNNNVWLQASSLIINQAFSS